VDKVKLGIVGVGGRGYGFGRIAVTNRHCEVVALADPNTERADRVAHNLEISVPVYDNMEQMFAKTDLDALIIATPDYQHKEQALKAFEAGKHLLLEKPIATTVADGLAIAEGARTFDRVLYMGFNMRHDMVVVEMKRLIAEQNAVGTPFHLTSLEYYNGGRTYMARWNRLSKYSGGLFVHKGTHDFDVLNWINMPARPAWVAASAAVNALDQDHLPFTLEEGETYGPYCSDCPVAHKCPDAAPSHWYDPHQDKKPLFDDETAAIDGYHKDLCIFQSDKDTHDNAMALVEYDNGSRAYHSEVFVTQRSNREYIIIGDLGHLEADLHANRIDIYPRWTKNKVTHNLKRATGGHGGSDPDIVDRFLQSVLRGERPRAGVADGVWSLAVGCAAELARRERRLVEIRELMDPQSDLLRAD